MSARKSDSISTTASDALSAAGIPYAVHQFDKAENLAHESEALPRDAFDDPERVFRSILCQSADKPAVLAVPIIGRVDFERAAAALGFDEVSAVSPTDVKKVTGYDTSVLTPIGIAADVAVLVDVTALDHHTVFVSAGELGYVLELAPDDLLTATGGRLAPLTVPEPTNY